MGHSNRPFAVKIRLQQASHCRLSSFMDDGKFIFSNEQCYFKEKLSRLFFSVFYGGELFSHSPSIIHPATH